MGVEGFVGVSIRVQISGHCIWVAWGRRARSSTPGSSKARGNRGCM